MFRKLSTLWLVLWLSAYACVGTTPAYRPVRIIGLCLGKLNKCVMQTTKDLNTLMNTIKRTTGWYYETRLQSLEKNLRETPAQILRFKSETRLLNNLHGWVLF